jgi:hypothetical protein
MRPQMRFVVTFVAAIPATVHLDSFNVQIGFTRMTRESFVHFQIIEMRQNQFALMMAQMTVVTKQNDVLGFVAAALALRPHVMILETAMIVLLRQRRAPANAAPQAVTQVNLKTRPIFEAHF